MARSMVRRGTLVLAGVLAMSGTGWGAGQQAPRVTEASQATGFDSNPVRTYGPPSLVGDPENPLHAFALLAEVRTKRCGLMRCLDGGLSGTRLASSLLRVSYPFC